MEDGTGWDRLVHKMRDDIRQAQESGDHAAACRLQDEFVEYECMDACIQLFRDGGRLDYYEEVAGRAEKTSPEFAKTLKNAVESRRDLERSCKPYDYGDMLRKIDKDAERAERRGDHAAACRLRDEYVEFECMNKALEKMPNVRQQITHYGEVADRIERINPSIAKTLRKAATRLRAVL